MARLNIETGIWADGRFQNLLIKVGDRFRATGMIVHLWTLAQQYWCPDRKPIPDVVWAASELPEEVIQCGLAERREGGVYAHWLRRLKLDMARRFQRSRP